jgi:hypothetical protein
MPFLSRAFDAFFSRSLLGTRSFRLHWRSRLIHGFVRLDAAIPPMIAQKFASYPSSSLEWENLMVSAVGDLLPLCEH